MRKGEQTKASIIDAATALFSEKGVYRVTFPELAKRVGLTHAALYRYFPDHDALFLACVDHAVQEGRTKLDASVDLNSAAEKRLRDYVNGNVEWFANYPSAAALVLATFYFSLQNQKIGDFHRQFVASSLKRLESHIIQGARERAWPMTQSLAKARQIHNLMVGEMIKTLAMPVEMTSKDRRDLLWKAVVRILK